MQCEFWYCNGSVDRKSPNSVLSFAHFPKGLLDIHRCSQELNFHGICSLSIMLNNIDKSLGCFLLFVLARNSWSLLHPLSFGTDLISVLSRLLFRERLASHNCLC